MHSEQAQREAPNGNLLISDRWNTGIGEMGLLLNVSYVGIQFLDSTREQSLVIAKTNQVNGDGSISNYAPGAPAGLRFPDAQGNFLGYGNRWRPSANAAFQWKPTPSSKSTPTAFSRASARRITIAGCSSRSSAAPRCPAFRPVSR
ncbi:hypothetical protein PIB19_19875 [Sphingomonas sp. 7/4-4]|uniref:hypothetical protein n=1 Tax=Sphingomonas sp. 7/4-4 TaxID=3018446 RepID=UPI0022F39FC7|nr:hypothetical protein [Sphingomonas sp. 7/4-4]WBY07560.1 hypothetical protein PIB19_19875 [Sphingomonas sp. 7/4-4]